MIDLAPCPCGETPTKLTITENGQGMKYALASGNCCGEWFVEFRSGYFERDTEECMRRAINGWNSTKRADK